MPLSLARVMLWTIGSFFLASFLAASAPVTTHFSRAPATLVIGDTTLDNSYPFFAYDSSINQFLGVWMSVSHDGALFLIMNRYISPMGQMSAIRNPCFKGAVQETLPLVAHVPGRPNNVLLWSSLPLLNTPPAGFYSELIDRSSTTKPLRIPGLDTAQQAFAYNLRTHCFLFLAEGGFLTLNNLGHFVSIHPYPGYVTLAQNQMLFYSSRDDCYYLIGQSYPPESGRNMDAFVFQKIASDGSPLSNTVRYFSFHSFPNSNDALMSAAFDITHNVILMTFSNTRPPYETSELYSIRVSTAGVPIGKPVHIAAKITGTLATPIALTPSGFVVVFEREGKLWIRELNFSGNPIFKEGYITDETFYFINGLHIAASSNKARFLVYWHGNIVNGILNIYGELLQYHSTP